MPFPSGALIRPFPPVYPGARRPEAPPGSSVFGHRKMPAATIFLDNYPSQMSPFPQKLGSRACRVMRTLRLFLREIRGDPGRGRSGTRSICRAGSVEVITEPGGHIVVGVNLFKY